MSRWDWGAGILCVLFGLMLGLVLLACLNPPVAL